tara:strand:- start:7074 stop:7430 length:357 start_codon:yes stop_codon:yes gene_type:complete
MQENPVKIIIGREKRYRRKFGIPYFPYWVSTYSVGFSDCHLSGKSEHDPVRCLTDVLVTLELNEDGNSEGPQFGIERRPIGPIKGVFRSISESNYEPMEKLLEIYARSQGTSVTFEVE